MPFIHLANGVRIHFETAGEGVPLVFIHGWGMSGKVWRFQEGLADGYRLIVPDLRGHGLSSAPKSGYSFQDFAEDVDELFTALCLNNAILIGWSMGVQVALRAFPRIRERLAALVFVSGTPRFTATDDYPLGLAPMATHGLGLRLKRCFEGTLADFFQGMFAEREFEPGMRERMIPENIMGKLPAQHAAQGSLASLASEDLRNLLHVIDLPVLLVHGSADIICLPAASRYMAEQLPNARLAMMNGAGHAPFISKPTEFGMILRTFLDGIHADD